MATAFAEPRTQLTAVIPPAAMPVTTAVAPPAPPIAEQPDVPTIDSLPLPARQIVAGFSENASPQERQVAAALMRKQEQDTAEYSPNVQPQWGKMLFSALEGKWGDVYKYYNGGATREEEARDSAGNTFYKEYNERGFTGILKDRAGKPLQKKQVDELLSRGGVITKSDDQALRTTNWVNAQTNSTLLNRGLASQLDIIRNDAYNAARTAGAANQNIDEQLGLAKKLKPVLDHFGTLNEEARKRLLGYINRYNTNASSQQNQAESARSANVGGLQSTSQTGTLGVGLGQQVGPEGAAVPGTATGKIGGTGGLSATGMGQATTGVSGREQTAATAAQSQQQQTQQNLQAAIMQELQGVIKTPEQFYDFMRLQALNAANDAAYKNVPDRVRPPGYVDIPEIDPNVSGSASIVANRVNQLRNNALMAAWSNELFKAQREAVGGKPIDVDAVADRFQKSDLFKAINNTYAARLNYERTGQMPNLKGVLRVDRANRLIKD